MIDVIRTRHSATGMRMSPTAVHLMKPMFRLPLATLFLVAAPLALDAQARARPTPAPAVPANMRPPAGKCRIWMENVSPAQQPAPTDCQTALRQKPANGTVVFGPPLRTKEPGAFEPRVPARGADTTAARGTGRADSTARRETGRRDSTATPARARTMAPARDS
jgi:hypothetical protein